MDHCEWISAAEIPGFKFVVGDIEEWVSEDDVAQPATTFPFFRFRCRCLWLVVRGSEIKSQTIYLRISKKFKQRVPSQKPTNTPSQPRWSFGSMQASTAASP
jgi:hypothetical protein